MAQNDETAALAAEAHDESYVAPTPSQTAAPQMSAVVRQWVIDCVHGSPIARNTEGYNFLITSALPELLRRLAA